MRIQLKQLKLEIIKITLNKVQKIQFKFMATNRIRLDEYEDTRFDWNGQYNANSWWGICAIGTFPLPLPQLPTVQGNGSPCYPGFSSKRSEFGVGFTPKLCVVHENPSLMQFRKIKFVIWTLDGREYYSNLLRHDFYLIKSKCLYTYTHQACTQNGFDFQFVFLFQL